MTPLQRCDAEIAEILARPDVVVGAGAGVACDSRFGRLGAGETDDFERSNQWITNQNMKLISATT